jgi:hypothetical protein
MVDLLFRGDIDLAKDYMDMKIRATPLGSVGSLVGKVPVAGQPLKKAKDTVLSTDLVARGPIGDPKVTIAVMEKFRPNSKGN